MRQLLTQSEHFKLYAIYEEAQLEGPSIDGHIVVGDFYGNVACACIDQRERWCITAGSGLIIYRLTTPFEGYRYNYETAQWKELWRSDDVWWPEAIYQIEENIVRIVIDVLSSAKGVYDLDTESLQVTKRI